MKPLRRTYFDVTQDRRPRLMSAIDRRLESIGAVEWPLDFDQMDAAGGKADVDAELAAAINDIWEQRSDVAARLGLTRQAFDQEMISQGVKDAIQEALVYDYATMLNFKAFGQKTFYFSENLVERLANTELNVAAAMVVPPFRACLFVLDDDISRNALYAIHGKPAPAPTGEPISVFVTVRPRAGGGRTLSMMIWHADDKRSRMFVKRELLLADGARVENALKTDWATILPPDQVWVDEAPFYNDGFRFFRIVVNGILYLGSSSPDVSGELRAEDRIPAPAMGMSAKGRRHLEHKKATSTRLPYIEVGGVVRPLGSPAGQSSKSRVEVRLLVRGHWKSQVHGPGMTLRKLIHVEPYWRGPEMAELVDRPYLVK
ncbi:MAG: hypothetical protein HQL41_13970 [Alphaproteobacteria bacterium]|nr:hypothetical protein [Alphaproteobacteria bacterium]